MRVAGGESDGRGTRDRCWVKGGPLGGAWEAWPCCLGRERKCQELSPSWEVKLAPCPPLCPPTLGGVWGGGVDRVLSRGKGQGPLSTSSPRKTALHPPANLCPSPQRCHRIAARGALLSFRHEVKPKQQRLPGQGMGVGSCLLCAWSPLSGARPLTAMYIFSWNIFLLAARPRVRPSVAMETHWGRCTWLIS